MNFHGTRRSLGDIGDAFGTGRSVNNIRVARSAIFSLGSVLLTLGAGWRVRFTHGARRFWVS